MRSRTLAQAGLIALAGIIGVGGLGALGGCATPAAKVAGYPVSGWASPVFKCAAPAPAVAIAPPPPPPEPAKPEPQPEPEPPPPPPPKAEAKAELIELSETVQFETESTMLLDRSKQLLDDV